jgi:hypothetical protein
MILKKIQFKTEDGFLCISQRTVIHRVNSHFPGLRKTYLLMPKEWYAPPLNY